ncbi:hypothetical protein JCM10550A_17450 [Methanogenium cariaci]
MQYPHKQPELARYAEISDNTIDNDSLPQKESITPMSVFFARTPWNHDIGVAVPE